MQAIAAENNLSETAFLVPASRADGERGPSLRWFTPVVEVDLCGHATLAAGFVVLEQLAPRAERVRFHTRSGPLTVERDGDELGLDLPAAPPRRRRRALRELPRGARRHARARSLAARLQLCVFGSAAEVRALAPEMSAARARRAAAVICTAPGDEPGVDFVSRFFAPAKGVPEDPVTGSAHAALTPVLERAPGAARARRAPALRARRRACAAATRAQRVRLFGRVAPYLCGTIEVPG